MAGVCFLLVFPSRGLNETPTLSNYNQGYAKLETDEYCCGSIKAF